MPHTPEAYAYTPVNYVGESGSIPALLLYERDGLSYLRFQTKSWPHYDGWGLWSTVGIWSEHVVRADPREPAVADLLKELEREVADQRQYRSNCRHRANVQWKQENGQGTPAPKTCARVPQGNGLKPRPGPAKPPARQQRRRSFFEARQINWGSYARRFPLPSVIPIAGMKPASASSIGCFTASSFIVFLFFWLVLC